MAEQPAGKVRRGDRYIFEDMRVTVSEVLDDPWRARIQMLNPDTGTRWTKEQTLPFPGGFIKVYSAPPERCEACDSQPPAPGMAYCDDCLDTLAGVIGGPSHA